MSADTAFPMSLKVLLSRLLSEHPLYAKVPELTSGVQFRYMSAVFRTSVWVCLVHGYCFLDVCVGVFFSLAKLIGSLHLTMNVTQAKE